MEKNSRVYTVLYSKLPEIEKDRLEMLQDSLEAVLYYPHDYNMIQHFLFVKQFDSLINIECPISLSDIRKYFSVESQKGTHNEKIHSLYYWFNNDSSPDCYDIKDNNGFYRKCSLLTFQFDENQILTKVNTEFFAY